MKNSSLGKKVLITAGPTWVPIDDVRVLSNISTGKMGLLLAEEAQEHFAHVDLFLGPVGPVDALNKVRVMPFKYFHEFFELVNDQLKKTRYDVILHCAAVSDYTVRQTNGKISSKRKMRSLTLTRAPKVVDTIRRLNPKAFLTLFKLEANVSVPVLINRTKEALKIHRADLAVANMFGDKGYRGFVVDTDCVLAQARSRQELVKKLFGVLKLKAVL